MAEDEAPTPTPELNQLGGVRTYGLTLTAIVAGLTICSIIWVHRHRKVRVVKAHQPLFLTTLFVGLLITELAAIPLSIDDEIASQRGCDIACMSTAWLEYMGDTIVFAALYAKLRRINMLFNSPRFRRIKVEAKDVMAPFAVLFTLNLTIMLCWTILDPLRWLRLPIDGSNWLNTYGACTDMGIAGTVLRACAGMTNIIALLMVCYQAWRARHISDEFSESKRIGVVLYNWVQLLVIGLPSLVLLGHGNPRAKYCLEVSFLLAECSSMLLALFVPIFMHNRRPQPENDGSRVRISGLSEGANFSTRASTISVHGSSAHGSRSGSRGTTMVDDGQSCSPDSEEMNAVKAQLAKVQEANADLKQRIAGLEEQNKPPLRVGKFENGDKQVSFSVDDPTESETSVSGKDEDEDVENGRRD